MNSKQKGGLENTNDKEYIFEVNVLFNELLKAIESKNLEIINNNETNFLEYKYNEDSSLSKLIDNTNEKFYKIDDIKEIFNETLYYNKKSRIKTTFYDLISLIDNFIEKNKQDYLLKKLNSDLFFLNYLCY